MSRIYRRGRTWCIDYRDAGGKRRQQAIGSKEQASRALSERLGEVFDAKHLGIKAIERLTLEQYWPRYEEYARVNKRPSTVELGSWLIKPLLRAFGGTRLDELSAAKVEGYKAARLRDGCGPVGVNKEVQLLRAMLRRAVEWELLERDPVKRWSMLREPPGRVRYLSLEEVEAFLAACGPALRPVAYTALLTGMRRGELLALRWRDVDFRQGLIHVEDSKTGERRDVPMCPALAEVLADLPRESERVFGERQSIRSAFETARRRSGLQNFHFHDLRHTFASHLVMQGTSILVVQQLLGHRSLTMTLRYAHLAPDVRQAAVDLLSSKVGSIAGDPPEGADLSNTGTNLA